MLRIRNGMQQTELGGKLNRCFMQLHKNDRVPKDLGIAHVKTTSFLCLRVFFCIFLYRRSTDDEQLVPDRQHDRTL